MGNDREQAMKNPNMSKLVDMQYELYAYVAALMGSSSTADTEEVFRETNLRIVQLLQENPEIRFFNAWAKKVAMFRVMTWRKEQKRARVIFDSELLETVAANLEEEPYATDDRLRLMEACLKSFPPASRKILDDYYRDGLSAEQIAANLGTTAAAVRTTLWRLRVLLRKQVALAARKEEHA